MLHIIDNLPLQRSFLENIHSGDTVILKDNAVYAAKQENIKESLTTKTLAHLNLCVSQADLLLRNISNNELLRGVVILDNINDYQDILLDDIACRSCN
ncbi:MAG: DsrH/TusB family sulfur metabolism protein [Methyloprofundus sp.]|nr:DsrH/TusB family sulfur metabolism protein [Methyloprofundus sp.]MDT8425154.1 DsrH/TusB family sulfur metabolism protein [Methyloprofundus sp.]